MNKQLNIFLSLKKKKHARALYSKWTGKHKRKNSGDLGMILYYYFLKNNFKVHLKSLMVKPQINVTLQFWEVKYKKGTLQFISHISTLR